MTLPDGAGRKGARVHEQSGRHGNRSSGAGSRGGPAPAATVSLRTAARVLGISSSEAQALAEADAFPCGVIQRPDGYRVPFGVLLRVLRSRARSVSGPRSRPHDGDEKGMP